MPTLGQMQGDEFTGGPGGGLPPSGGGGVSGGGGGLRPGGNTAHNVASSFTQRYQDRLNSQLAQVSTLSETDPEAARAMLLDAWEEFLTGSQSFVDAYQGVGRLQAERVVNQALSTPALLQTVETLWGQTGGPSTGVRSLIEIPGGGGIGGTVGRITLGMIGLGIQLIGQARQRTTTPPPGGPPTTTPPPGPGGPEGGNTNGAPNMPPAVKTWFEQYMPWILTAGSIAANVWGANNTATTANRAAEIQAGAAREATALQQKMYQQNRGDLAPWRDVGRNALFRLSDLTGLQPTDRTPPVDYFAPPAGGPPPPGVLPPGGPPEGVTGPPPPESPPLNPSGLDRRPGPLQSLQVPNLEEMARKYRRSRQGAA